jgi:hypothetical protein
VLELVGDLSELKRPCYNHEIVTCFLLCWLACEALEKSSGLEAEVLHIRNQCILRTSSVFCYGILSFVLKRPGIMGSFLVLVLVFNLTCFLLCFSPRAPFGS